MQLKGLLRSTFEIRILVFILRLRTKDCIAGPGKRKVEIVGNKADPKKRLGEGNRTSDEKEVTTVSVVLRLIQLYDKAKPVSSKA
jgi:hypothetical protein